MGRIAVINQNTTDIGIADSLLVDFKINASSAFTSAASNSPIFETTVKAAKLWAGFVASPRSQQSAFWAAYSAMVPLNQPLPDMLANLKSFKPLGVTAKVCVFGTCGRGVWMVYCV